MEIIPQNVDSKLNGKDITWPAVETRPPSHVFQYRISLGVFAPLHISWEELEGLAHPLQWVWPITCLQVGEEVQDIRSFFYAFILFLAASGS